MEEIKDEQIRPDIKIKRDRPLVLMFLGRAAATMSAHEDSWEAVVWSCKSGGHSTSGPAG